MESLYKRILRWLRESPLNHLALMGCFQYGFDTQLRVTGTVSTIEETDEMDQDLDCFDLVSCESQTLSTLQRLVVVSKPTNHSRESGALHYLTLSFPSSMFEVFTT